MTPNHFPNHSAITGKHEFTQRDSLPKLESNGVGSNPQQSKEKVSEHNHHIRFEFSWFFFFTVNTTTKEIKIMGD